MHTYSRVRQDGGDYLYCVGYWAPPAYGSGAAWQPLRDCATEHEAVQWVSFLNGGESPYGFVRAVFP